MNSFIITPSGISGFSRGTSYTIAVDHPNYSQIVDAIRTRNYDAIADLVDVSTSLEKLSPNVLVDREAGKILYRGKPLRGAIVSRLLNMLEDNFDVAPMLSFVDNLMSNPSVTAQDELYGFMEANNLPITDDGHFIAWKRVNTDMTSFYDGSTEHVFGQVLSMDRDLCDSQRDNTCSSGLHFCSERYLPSYHGGKGRVLILKINPKDVVSIPSDYNNAKGRACAYIPIAEVCDGALRNLEAQQPTHVNAVVDTTTEDSGMSVPSDDLRTRLLDKVYQVGYEAGQRAGQSGTDRDVYRRLVSGGTVTGYAQGYVDGYKPYASVADESKSEATSRDDFYDEGFAAGFNACVAGTSGLYDILVTKDVNRNAFATGYVDGYVRRRDTAAEGDSAKDVVRVTTPDQSVADAFNKDPKWVQGYIMGYPAGRAKAAPVCVPATASSSFELGYVAGYKDGRGHAPRRYR